MANSKENSILIVGAGAFGLSTALHLFQNGYTNITVFERGAEVPPSHSAAYANDLKKIMRTEYEDLCYTDLAVEAMEAWKTPLFAAHFHRTGLLHCVSGMAEQRAKDALSRFHSSVVNHPAMAEHIVPINSSSSIRDEAWQLDGELPGWAGYLNRYDGYINSADALRGIFGYTQARGVKYVLGESAGTVTSIVYETTKQGAYQRKKARRSKGVRTKDGKFHLADLVIVATGTEAAKLIPELGQNVEAKAWSVAHIRLTDEEMLALRGIPVVYARDLGLYFEPDSRTNLLKLCSMGGGYVDRDTRTDISVLSEELESSLSFLAEDDERKIRELLRQTLPALADRPLVKKSVCWFADVEASDIVVDYVPGSDNTVVVLTGDSGQGFNMFPIMGKWTVDLLQSPIGQTVEQWMWKGERPKGDWGHMQLAML